MTKKLLITEAVNNQRIDTVLAHLDSKRSRSQWQKLIKQDLVWVNGRVASGHKKLKTGDELIIKTASKAKQLETAVGKQIPEIEIIAKTSDYLVINKPAGLIVHGTAHSNTVTLVDWLLKYYPAVKKVGDDPLRPGIVHRLDKAVSGLMVIALNHKAFVSLKEQFQNRSLDKRYLGLVYDRVTIDEGVINFLLERSSSGHKMAAKPISQGVGKEALTSYRVKQKFQNYSLLELTIKTGRTHQIRAHMAAFNHHLVGDDLYATATTRLKNKKFNLGRVWLVSVHLAFTDLEGQRVKFNIKPPKALLEILKNIK